MTKNRDIFAEIADAANHSDAQPVSTRQLQLDEPQPPTLPDRQLPTVESDENAIFAPRSVFGVNELEAELATQRAYYAQFMENLAPQLEETRIRIPVESFDWRIETDADRLDFVAMQAGAGEWEHVSIPHYDGPMGGATTLYRTEIEVTQGMLDLGYVGVCFKGVDYIAHVFMNGAFLGSHEGFFAPFEFDCTAHARLGINTLVVRVHNDAIMLGNKSWEQDTFGDKVYAATGPGWDNPDVGWQHCPPGMGIYQAVSIEARPVVHIHDIFVRPLLDDERAEAWVEVFNAATDEREIALELSLYGQNFNLTLFEHEAYELTGEIGPTVNYFRLPFNVPNPKVWESESPWLYQLHVHVTDQTTGTHDVLSKQFGMRSFVRDDNPEDGDYKGRFYFNGREVRLRGSNTMGHLQQCVMTGDWDQLRDDILLCKIANMNFLRLTQRPVQSEIYDYCDRLGMMTQTDLPLFGVIRRNKVVECVRQVEEMERLVRSHPCNIMISYINEALPHGYGKPHRNLIQDEMEIFFEMASGAVYIQNPDRIIKYSDGNYDPPDASYPDNHCYSGWYNGHGIDLGKLHRGYWQRVKSDWMFGCGEFGAEGLDSINTMRTYYPAEWLPQSDEEETDWSPRHIVHSQTADFHYLWFKTPNTLNGWVEHSQAHQAWITRLMTEAFRRNNRMNSIAIHLSIDAFPASWMKTIMDVDRQPKPAYFAYRDALTPLMLSMRTDRFAYTSGEDCTIELWVCNDVHNLPKTKLHYQFKIGNEITFAQSTDVEISACTTTYQGSLRINVPEVEKRQTFTIQAALIDEKGVILHDRLLNLDIFPTPPIITPQSITVLGKQDGVGVRLIRELGLQSSLSNELSDLIVIDDIDQLYTTVLDAINAGATAVILDLSSGTHAIGDHTIEVMEAGMNPRHFVSVATDHPITGDFRSNDLRFLYDDDLGYVTPFVHTTFHAEGWTPILTSGQGQWQSGSWFPTMAAAEVAVGNGMLRVCQIQVAGRVLSNPSMMAFARHLLDLD
jgi:hypothetical protein